MPGDRVMNGQWKRTYPWGTRTRRVISHWQCWLDIEEVYFDEHPYIPTGVAGDAFYPGPGRPPQYSNEQTRIRHNLQVSIKRWTKMREDYVGKSMWAVADGYGDKVHEARDPLTTMTADSPPIKRKRMGE